MAGDRVTVVPALPPDDRFLFDTAQMVFEGLYFLGRELVFDVAPDAQRFLVAESVAGAGAPPQIIVVQNWFEELRRLVPTD